MAPGGPIYGIREDGRVAVTAEQAWPNRPPPEPPPSADEIARACALRAACMPEDEGTHFLWGRYGEAQACAVGASLAYNPAERVIPFTEGMYWTRYIRFVNAAEGDCAQLSSIPLEPWLECQEDGCWSTWNIGTVRCEGEIAIFSNYDTPRDCARSGMLCDETSPTGCTDRPLTRCENGGRDRCDGSIKLGCDHCGFVSYRDCAFNGRGRCVETEDGAHCEYVADCEDVERTCTGTSLTLCAAGQAVSVDCTAIGMASCSSTPHVFEKPDAHCVPPESTILDASVPEASSPADRDASTDSGKVDASYKDASGTQRD